MSEDRKTDLIEKAAKGIADIQTKYTELEGKVDAISKDELAKMTDDATKTAEAIQKLEQKTKAQDQLIKDLELAAAKGTTADGMTDIAKKEYSNALISYMRKGTQIDINLVKNVAEDMAAKGVFGNDDVAREIMVKDYVSGSGPDGGYFIQADRLSTISKRIFETSAIRSVANVITTTSNEVELILDDQEHDSGWVGEVQARPDTNTAQIAVIKIPLHEVYAQPKATQRMLDDAGFNMEAWITEKIASEMGRRENTSFVLGDGSLKPKGFLDYAAWAAAGTYERNALEQVNSGTAGGFTADSFQDVWASLIAEYHANAVWMMKRATFGEVIKLQDGSGVYIINPYQFSNSPQIQLMGSPVIFADDMPAIAANALAVAFGDFKTYTIADRMGLRIVRDVYTSKPYIKFYSTKRVGGAVTNFEGIKIMKLAV